MQKVALYCRVSTQEQGDRRTIERQLLELRDYCKYHDYQIVKEYKDVISGTIMKRLELDQLKEDVKNKLFESVIISEISRISRGEDAIVDVILFERELEKYGVSVYFLDGSSDNEIVKAVRALYAKTERKDFIKRTQNGRLARARRDSALGGRTAYGYDYVPLLREGFRHGIWKKNTQESKNVNLIFDLMLQLGSEGRVIRELTARGIKPRSGKDWRRSSISKILKNEIYITGIAYYNKTKREGKRLVLREKSEWVKISVPKIITKDRFDSVQKIIRGKKNYFKNKTEYLLSGLIRCVCGSTFSGEVCKGKRYYRCNNRHNTFPKPRTCKAKMVSANNLEKSVWDAFSYVLSHPKFLKERIDYLNKDEKNVEDLLQKEKESLIKNLKKIEDKKTKLLDNHLEGIVSKKVIMVKMSELSGEEKGLQDQLSLIENRLSQLKNKPVIVENLYKFSKRFSEIQLEMLTFEEKREFLRIITKEIKYDSKTNLVNITGHVPITPENNKIELPLSWVNFSQHPEVLEFLPNHLLQFNIEVKI